MKRTIYDEDHEAFRASVREFLDREVVPHLEEHLADKALPREFWLAAGKQGFLGLEVPEEYGGAGGRRLPVQRGAARGARPRQRGAARSCVGIHADIVAPYLVELTTEEQRKRWLPGVASGELLTAIGMTEPSGGSDLAALKTTAVKRRRRAGCINGSKTFITNGYSADLVVVAARTAPEKKARGITLFGVETDAEGFSRGRKLDKVGQDESDTAELFFENVRVSDDDIVGELDNGFIHMMQNLPQERLGCAISNLAHARQILVETLEYAKERKAFGQADRLLPAQQVPARRAGHPGRRHPGLRRPVRGRAHAPSELTADRRRQGQVVDLPGAERDPRPLRPALRRLRLHERVPRRPRLARRPRLEDLGRLQRDHEGAHRPRPGVVSGPVGFPGRPGKLRPGRRYFGHRLPELPASPDRFRPRGAGARECHVGDGSVAASRDVDRRSPAPAWACAASAGRSCWR